MKLVIFTPVIKLSAIGRMVSLVTRALVSQGHDVVVVRTESPGFYGMDAHDFNVDPVSWNDTANVFNYIGEADILVYQIGDNHGFHQGCLEWLPEFSGIVCLHDYFLGHLFHDWSQHNRHQAYAILRGWYGDEVALRFFDEQDSDDFIELVRHLSPMTEWICSMASGVVTHSSGGIDRVLNSCSGPVFTVSLPYDTPCYTAKDSSSLFSSTGFYRELPDDCVIKINPEDELCSIQSALELLYEDSVLRDAVAIDGQLCARRTFTVENYVQKLVECALLSKKAHPVIAAAEYFAGVMRAWGATDAVVTMDNTVNPLLIFNCI